MRPTETADDSLREDLRGERAAAPPTPGVALVSSGGRPMLEGIPLQGGALEIGREGPVAEVIDDGRMSRRHARISFDGRAWTVRDLGSRNGTAVDGEELRGERSGEGLRVVRAGSSLFLLARDLNPLRAGVRVVDGTIMGPTLARAWQAIARAARFGGTLHLRGESGSGKELAARAFHALGQRSAGPFVAVNCATIPAGVAERLLFGTRKGAYSGADADAEGYVQSAHGGTLFLDEIAELDPAVQAKLLRVLETREVMPLGASRPRAVDLAICSATHKDLRAEVSAGRLREDLYFRVARPEVALPPLRARPEDIPWLIEREVRRVEAAAGGGAAGGAGGAAAGELLPRALLVEACLLRPWPGNVRELVAEIRTAAQEAISAGGTWVEVEHLSPSAGIGFAPQEEAAPAEGGPASARGGPASARGGQASAPAAPDREAVEQALRRERGNISRAARALGLHRTQLRRLLAKLGIEARRFGEDGSEAEETGGEGERGPE